VHKLKKEAVMARKINEAVCNRLEKWLDGVSMESKIRTLETGRLHTCTKCGLTVFDKQTIEERIRRKCIESGSEHTFVENDYYIILKRGFVGIIDVVACRYETPEAAIERYFKNKR